MEHPTKRIYYRSIKALLKKRKINRNSKILVVCGGSYDEEVLQLLKFKQVLITSIRKTKLNKYKFKNADAQSLPFKDNSFDYVFVHAGLHHCASPHRALLEMFRVAKNGIFVAEAQDNLITRLFSKLKLTQDYEFVAIKDTGGGVNDTKMPNYVYRWTRREVEKVVRSFDYVHEPNITFFSEFHFPACFEGLGYGFIKSKVARLSVLIMNIIIPRYGNLFCFYIDKKNSALHSWIPTTYNKL